MPNVRIKKRFDAIGFTRNRNADLTGALPCRPSLDQVFANLHSGKGGLPVLAQDRNGLPQNGSVALAIYQCLRRRDLLKRISPNKHSAIGSEIVWRYLDGCCKIVDRSPTVTHSIQRFSPQHVAMGVRQRPNPATPVRQAEGSRQVAALQRIRRQHFQSLMMWLVEMP
jgi:hypothetical protein